MIMMLMGIRTIDISTGTKFCKHVPSARTVGAWFAMLVCGMGWAVSECVACHVCRAQAGTEVYSPAIMCNQCSFCRLISVKNHLWRLLDWREALSKPSIQ